jgi:hypothetical protein
MKVMMKASTKRVPRPEPARHRWVAQWMVAKGDALRRLVADTQADIDRFEAAHHPRLRGRKAADRMSHEALTHVLVVNLAHAALVPSLTGRLAIRAGNPAKGAGRHGNPAFGEGVRPLIGMMHEMGLLEFRLPVAMRGEVSSIAPTAEFTRTVEAWGITLGDFGRDVEREEVLVLTRNVGTVAAPVKHYVNYAETAETTALRDAVSRLNAYLAKADIEFISDGLSPRIDPHQRTLVRSFVLLKGDKVARFDRARRLHGAFWMGLEASRRGGLRVQGEPVAELDYSSMFARLAYARLGVDAPEGDLYAIPGLEGRCEFRRNPATDSDLKPATVPI